MEASTNAVLNQLSVQMRACHRTHLTGKALLWYRRGHGFKSCSILKFFRALTEWHLCQALNHPEMPMLAVTGQKKEACEDNHLSYLLWIHFGSLIVLLMLSTNQSIKIDFLRIYFEEFRVQERVSADMRIDVGWYVGWVSADILAEYRSPYRLLLTISAESISLYSVDRCLKYTWSEKSSNYTTLPDWAWREASFVPKFYR